ncbi:hypothetical protein EAI75_01805 [Bifidobacterium longum]|nr:hypothetical protein GBJ40_04980 [Bifidobacterium longum]KAB6926559.1 hypothetical protein GBJ42_00580 [Bifidobacterium longum]KAB6931204.1 hypothetical protein GBJ38_01815 [Bifidobacterium longum]KAB6932502.1 hypothetical protein GBJ27_00580 [Bifidobacterium longum]KAB6935217.1 hypothetical protein GBJ43_01810 [Bifidobacterium longum]
MSEASNPKRRRMNQPRPSGRPEAKATPPEPSATVTRAMACFSSKVNRCDVIHTLHYVVLPRTGQPHFSKRLHSLR